MRLMVIDVETTGVEVTDQVVEVGMVISDDDGAVQTRTFLVKASASMNVMARAAHHITDAEIDHFGVPIERLAGFIPRADVMVAHNIEFDRRLLIQSGVPADVLPVRQVCSFRCARHVFPDAPSHANQVLRYWLNLELPFPLLHHPHRALPDAIVTYALMQRLLKHHDIDELVRMTTAPVILSTVKFGKHRGKKWGEVDVDYLRWVTSVKDFEPDVIHTAKHWIGVHASKDAPDSPPEVIPEMASDPHPSPPW